ncbi:AEC family transporter [Salinicola sp. DM10]|uniref:AEC family transporter n=1 Tax=Salinicola sp. DM10 TaxID=2815721 RepID=UPI001A8DA703|nr:AEC family transporter [Salinicola sp. DM10]MCE3027256.1 AEC family transporter [Salinicola sp. DM10]
MLAQLFAVMAPVLAGASIGFGWIRLGYSYPTEFVTKLVFNVGTPALVLASLANADVDPGDFGMTLLATLLVLAGLALASLGVARLLNKSWRVILSPMMYPNTGNMGLPVSLYAFGHAGFTYAMTAWVANALIQFTVGMMMASRGNPWKALLKNPTLYSIALSLLFLLSGTPLPAWLGNTVHLLSGLTIPLMLITLGVSLASIQARNLSSGLIFTLCRVPIALGLSFGIAALLGLPPLAASALALQMSMPVAVYNYLFAQRARREPEYVASLVFCSTLLAFVYLPLELAFLLPS